MAKPAGQLERSLAALTLGVQQSISRRAQSSVSEQAGEVQQQLQVELSGHAALAVVFIDAAVTWRLPFVYAPQQRLAAFGVPQFGYGIEFTAVPDDLVAIHASVLKWTKDARNWYVGAMVRFTAQAPAADDVTQVAFEAMAHLTFQGYAAQPEDTGA